MLLGGDGGTQSRRRDGDTLGVHLAFGNGHLELVSQFGIDATCHSDGVDVIAHRGASVAERENTVEAFRRAVVMGAAGIELDVRRTADGALVVHHDAHVADGRVIIDTLADDLPSHVPSLEAALEACAGAWVNVEIKNSRAEPDFDPLRSLADDVVRTLRATDDDERWVVSSFDLAMVDRVQGLGPGLPTAWLVVAIPDDVELRLAAGRHHAVHPWVHGLEQHHVERLHAGGYRVNAWTCNEPDRLRELAAWGVDGVCTDVPDVAHAAIHP